MSDLEQFEAEWKRIGWPDGPNTKEQCRQFWQASRRSALEEAADLCDRIGQLWTRYGDADECADAIRELANGGE